MSQISSFSALAANVVHQANDNIVRNEHHGRAPHRTGAPVLRHSKEAGTFEHKFFIPPATGETDRMLRTARKLIDAAKRLRREQLHGRKLTATELAIVAITPAAVRVYEEILTLARLCGGKVYPSYERIADRTELGRTTVSRAIAILKGVGLLDWQRRFKRVEIEGVGPRYK
ncbi:MAG: helix-turn-helix domain-containing protein, partial [Oxalobacteraceae bacterium]